MTVENFVVRPYDAVQIVAESDPAPINVILTPGAAGPAGPAGSVGPAGPAGDRGEKGDPGDAYAGPGWFFGEGEPYEIEGSKENDLYLDVTTGVVYRLEA